MERMAEKRSKKEEAEVAKERIRDLSREFGKKIQEGLGKKQETTGPVSSREYKQFKESYIPKKESFYEKACNLSEKILPISPDKKDIPEMEESIRISHLNITPKGVISFAILGPLVLVMSIILIFFLIPFILFGTASLFIVALSLVIAIVFIMPLKKVPIFLANNWRLKASNQMVLCVFYIVTYMRHTSNLELAINFAAERLKAPLSYDLKKVLWDVETEKFGSIKESLDRYLDTWKKWNMEFIEAMHLIESSLYEPSEERRIDSLEKSLTVMLDETYEKMLHYAHDLQSPITMLHMLGVVLPILGLVILPLAVSFMDGIEWYHIAFLYNLIIPVGVYYLGRTILAKRPTGYGESDISEESGMKRYKNVRLKLGNKEFLINPLVFSIAVAGILIFIGLTPLLAKLVFSSEALLAESEILPGFKFLGYRATETGIIGPYGVGAGIMSLLIVLGVGLGAGLFYKLRSKNVIKIRDETRNLEKEFASALFQLGNRLGDGLPAEIAFSKVANVMEGTNSGKFFRMTSLNINKLGMSVEDAIFDNKVGSLTKYPSSVIESAMKVLTESARKGPRIASYAIINVSRYIKEIHRVNERLKDLMSDIISNMKSQISFLTPAIAGIVIGITSMITTILGSLSEQMTAMQDQGTEMTAGAGLTNLIVFGQGIPSFYFQIIVGIYVVQLVFILTELVNGIENGSDVLQERFLKGQNLIRSTVLYSFIALVVMIIFNLVAGTIVSRLG